MSITFANPFWQKITTTGVKPRRLLREI